MIANCSGHKRHQRLALSPMQLRCKLLWQRGSAKQAAELTMLRCVQLTPHPALFCNSHGCDNGYEVHGREGCFVSFVTGLQVVDPAELTTLARVGEAPAVIAVAAFFGTVRLIDNCELPSRQVADKQC